MRSNAKNTLNLWEKTIFRKDDLIIKCCEEIGSANTSEERNFYHRIYDLIKPHYFNCS